jgi:circadian clock protein KaiB
MKKQQKKRVIIEVAKAEKNKKPKYALTLYITGNTPQSSRAVINLKRLCNEHLMGRHNLKVIDIYQQPQMAKEAQIIAAPTLIKKMPMPIRRFIGDMSNEERLLIGLDIPHDDESEEPA